MSLTLTRRHNVDRFGYLIPTKYGNVPMMGAVATYRPGEGRFGGAVAVEEGTTNCIVSRDFEAWASYVTGNATGTVEFRQDPIYGKVVKLKKTDGGSGRFGLRGTLSGLSGSLYTQSVYVRALSGTGCIACVYVDAAKTGGGFIISSTYRNLSDLPLGQWVRIVATKDGSPDTLAGGGFVYIWVDTDNGECEFAYPQVEAKPFATSFVDGTRATGGLEYPGSVLPLDEATLICWVKAHEGSTDQRRDFWAINNSVSSDDRLILSRNITGSGWGFHFRLAGGSQFELRHNVPLDFGWHMIGFRYRYNASSDRYDLALIFDGDIVATGTSANAGILKNIYRLYSDGNHYAANCLIDELLILPYAASEEEIVSWYEAQGPLSPHPQASLQWDRQTVRPAQMVKL